MKSYSFLVMIVLVTFVMVVKSTKTTITSEDRPCYDAENLNLLCVTDNEADEKVYAFCSHCCFHAWEEDSDAIGRFKKIPSTECEEISACYDDRLDQITIDRDPQEEEERLNKTEMVY